MDTLKGLQITNIKTRENILPKTTQRKHFGSEGVKMIFLKNGFV